MHKWELAVAAGRRHVQLSAGRLWASTLDALEAISRPVAALMGAGEIVYVQYGAGVQRSPLVASAVLIQMGWRLSAASGCSVPAARSPR
jgi:hypothetical protein